MHLLAAQAKRDNVLRQDPLVHIVRPNDVPRRAAQVINTGGAIGMVRRHGSMLTWLLLRRTHLVCCCYGNEDNEDKEDQVE